MLCFLATRNGLEPSTSSVTGWRANRLHHRAIFNWERVDYIKGSPFCKELFYKSADSFFIL